MERLVAIVEGICLEVEPFLRNVERYAQKVEHTHFIRQFTWEVEHFMAKVEYPYQKVEPFHRNVERYAQKVEHAHFIRQFT